MHRFKHRGFMSCAALALLLPGRVLGQTATPGADTAAASSNGQLEEIIVTATKTGAARLQKTPIAITAFTGDQLAQTISSNVKDLAQFIPSLNISLATTNPVITLRGVGTNNVFNGSDPDVTMQVDGVYIARPSAMNNDFLDVARVEVLRGPQGTLYGRNAIGGTINIISRTPLGKLEALGVVTMGNYGLIQTQAYISGGLVPGVVQASISGTYTSHNDYEKNIALNGQSGVNNANHGGVRGQLRVELSDAIDATTRADYTEQDENLQALYHLQAPFPPAKLANSIIGDDTRIAINSPSTVRYHGSGISEEINVRFGDGFNLKSISALRRNRYTLFTDNDGTELNLIRGGFHEKERQRSQEFDLNGRVGPIDAVIGAYYFDEHASTNVFAELFAPGVKINSLPFFYNRSMAVFGQGVYHITPTLSFTAGVRYTTERKKIDSTVKRTFFLTTNAFLPGFPILISDSKKFNATTPKFGVDWQATPDILVYASATRGYKSGGTNYAASSLATASFFPETMWSYEGGFKADLLDHHLRLNVSGFHYDYGNLQLQSVLLPGITTILNAANARVNGIDAEVTAKVTRTFQLSGNLSALRAKYTSFPKAPVPNALGPLLFGDPNFSPNPVALPGAPGSLGGSYDAKGHYLNQAPRFSGTIAAQNDFPLASGAIITARADMYFQTRVFYEPTNTRYQSQGAYQLINAQIGIRPANSRIDVRLWAKNLTNKHYLIAFQANGVGPAGTAAAPRTFGIRVDFKL